MHKFKTRKRGVQAEMPFGDGPPKHRLVTDRRAVIPFGDGGGPPKMPFGDGQLCRYHRLITVALARKPRLVTAAINRKPRLVTAAPPRQSLTGGNRFNSNPHSAYVTSQ